MNVRLKVIARHEAPKNSLPWSAVTVSVYEGGVYRGVLLGDRAALNALVAHVPYERGDEIELVIASAGIIDPDDPPAAA